MVFLSMFLVRTPVQRCCMIVALNCRDIENDKMMRQTW